MKQIYATHKFNLLLLYRGLDLRTRLVREAKMSDYSERSYLSATEAAGILGISVAQVHRLVREELLKSERSASGQHRFNINDVEIYRNKSGSSETKPHQENSGRISIPIRDTVQTVICGNSQDMKEIKDNSVHLAITSPPYFNAKLYSNQTDPDDLGNVHELGEWLERIGAVWAEVYRTLMPGRKFFLNIMNLPVRENGSFRTLNLVGKTVDLCESVGFVFKRDIVWHKTNGVRAHFGSFPYPGGILINNMHESILEFQKPDAKGGDKYAHLTPEIKEKSKLDKDFWLTLKNSDVWTMHPTQSGGGRAHIAPFPRELPYRLIRAYSFIGETVIDPFTGSGMTLQEAAKLGRNGIGYEINPAYFELCKVGLKEVVESKI